MKVKIYCTTIMHGKHSFFVRKDGVDYYLFSQAYRKGVQQYFSNPLLFGQAIDFSKAKKDCAVLRTMEKIMLYTKYIEREYKIAIYKKNNGKQNKSSNERLYA